MDECRCRHDMMMMMMMMMTEMTSPSLGHIMEQTMICWAEQEQGGS